MYISPWKIIEENVGEGGQGEISKVVNEETGQLGALKVLKKKEDSLIRSRFHREAQAYNQGFGGIPELYKDETANFKEPNANLYIISQWIEGANLDKWHNKNFKGLTLSSILDIVERLIDILKPCHELEILHRDIKPQNIMISQNGEPFLVDFGMSQLEVEEITEKTDAGAELGNRFLRLPEYGIKSHAFSQVSDVTHLVGVFFYLITGQSPRQLLDAFNKKPHERIDLSAFVEAQALRQVTRIFELGFQWHIENRFNSLDHFRKFLTELRHVLEGGVVEVDNSELDEALEYFNSDFFREIEAREVLMRDICHAYLTRMNELSNPKGFESSGSEDKDPTGRFYSTTFSLAKQGSSKPQVHYLHRAECNEDSTLTLFSGIEDRPVSSYFTSSTADKIGLIDAAKAQAQSDFESIIKIMRSKYDRIQNPRKFMP